MSITSAEATVPCLSEEDRTNLRSFEAKLDLIRDRTKSVALRYHVGAYLVGRPGTAKTHTVRAALDDLDRPWIYRNARMSPMGLWGLLADFPEHTIVLDDISTIFGNMQAVQVILAAL